MSQKSALPVLLLTVFLDLVGFSIVLPIYAELLAFYSAEDSGLLSQLNALLASTFQIHEPMRHAAFFGGALGALYSTLQFIVTPWWGRLSDRVGRRRVLILTVLMNVVGYALWMFAGSFVLFVVSRVVAALGSGNISVASAAAADMSTPRDRSKAMGLLGAAIGLGFITGPAIGSAYELMPKPELFEPGFSVHPFTMPAALALGLSLVNLAWLLARFKETLPSDRKAEAASVRPRSFRSLFGGTLAQPSRLLNLSYFLFIVGIAGFEATLVFLASDRLGWKPRQVGYCMVWLGLWSVLIQGGLVRRLAPRYGERRLALAGLGILVPAFLGLAFVALKPSGLGLLLAVTLLSAGIGLVSPTLAALASLMSGPSEQGRVLGAYRSAGALGRAVGPLTAAVLYFGFGAGAPYLGAAALAILPLLLVSRVRQGASSDATPRGLDSGRSRSRAVDQ